VSPAAAETAPKATQSTERARSSKPPICLFFDIGIIFLPKGTHLHPVSKTRPVASILVRCRPNVLSKAGHGNRFYERFFCRFEYF
jgi:hypothetical protein